MTDREPADFGARQIISRRDLRNAALPSNSPDDIPLNVIMCENVDVTLFGEIRHFPTVGIRLGMCHSAYTLQQSR